MCVFVLGSLAFAPVANAATTQRANTVRAAVKTRLPSSSTTAKSMSSSSSSSGKGTTASTTNTTSTTQTAVEASTQPKVTYPASGVAFEERDGGNGSVNVYVAWTYDGDESAVDGWEICYYRAGSSCGVVGNNHVTKGPNARKSSISFPASSTSTAWKWKVGRQTKSGTVDWAPVRDITIYPEIGLLEPQSPTANASVTVPGTLSFSWKAVANVEYYLFCHQSTTYTTSWNCVDRPYELGNTFTVYKTQEPSFSKTFSTYGDWSELVGSTTSAKRGWGFAACRNVQEQSDDDGGQPPVTALHCKRSGIVRFNVNLVQ